MTWTSFKPLINIQNTGSGEKKTMHTRELPIKNVLFFLSISTITRVGISGSQVFPHTTQ